MLWSGKLKNHLELTALRVMFETSRNPSLSPTVGVRFVLPKEDAAAAAAAKLLQSCSTLCNPIDGSPPGSPIPGILQARTLEWVAISFSNA